MKRKLQVSSATTAPLGPTPPEVFRPPRKRQPQTSCDFCRLKKLKCDRAQPCSSCVARGRPCNGQLVASESSSGALGTGAIVDGLSRPFVPPTTLTTSAPDHDIRARLQRLEDTVFHGRGANGWMTDADSACAPQTRTDSTPHPISNQPLTPATNCSGDLITSDYSDKLVFRLAEPGYPGGSSLGGDVQPQTETRCILLPSQEDGLALLEHYLAGPHVFIAVLDSFLARRLIRDLYTRLGLTSSSSSSSSNRPNMNIKLGKVALLLTIAAASAFFWDESAATQAYAFPSDADAARQSRVWRNDAWDMLDMLQRGESSSIEEIQARLILAEVVFHVEGCSARFRRLHSGALGAAREMSLHLLDLPGQTTHDSDCEEGGDVELAREVKRRVWWQITSTDWLLSVMGGPLYRSYTVHPHQMNVRLPRNTTDPLTPDPPITALTDMSYLLHRTRLATVCRQIVDALPPLSICTTSTNNHDVDSLPYAQVLALDALFTDVMATFPQSFTLSAPIDPRAPINMAFHRHIFHMALHARRAHLFRPFLQQRGASGLLRDGRYERFRGACLESARAVLAIAAPLMRESLAADADVDGKRTGYPWRARVHRFGPVIGNLFIACVVLATDPGLRGQG